MPEAIEYLKMAALLREKWLKRRIVGIKPVGPKDKKYVMGQSWSQFESTLQGKKIVEIKTYGKNLLVELEQGWMWRIHFSSTGWLYQEGEPALKVSEAFLHSTAESTNRIWFDLDDGSRWVYRDARTWGKFWVGRAVAIVGEICHRYGPDWIRRPEQAAAVLECVRTKRAAKDVLTDQGLAAGIGNYLACEILFKAEIFPRRTWDKLDLGDRKRITKTVVEVLRESLEKDDHKHWMVFKRKGLPCRRCGTPIAYVKDGLTAARGSYFCPLCQKT